MRPGSVAAGDGDLRDLREGNTRMLAITGPPGVIDTGGRDGVRRWVLLDVEQCASEEDVAHGQSPAVVHLVEQRGATASGATGASSDRSWLPSAHWRPRLR